VSDAIPLAGDGFTPAGLLRLLPEAGIDFGSIAVGATSGAFPALLENQGNAAVNGIVFATGGAFATAPGGNCGPSLGAGDLCTQFVTLTPGAAGLAVGSLAVSGTGGHFDQITLRGQGIDTAGPVFGSSPVEPGPIDFAEQDLGAPVGRTLQVFELGGADLLVGSADITGAHAGDFGITTPLPLLIADGAPAQSIGLACRPGAVGARSALLTLQTNDPARPTVSFALDCEGVAEGEDPDDGDDGDGDGPGGDIDDDGDGGGGGGGGTGALLEVPTLGEWGLAALAAGLAGLGARRLRSRRRDGSRPGLK
jgi:hypothetical protein